MSQSATLLGPVCAFLSSVTWALGSAGYSRISRDHSAFAVNFTRALFGFPLFVVTAFVLAGGFGEGLREFSRLSSWHVAWFTLSMFSSYAFGDVIFLWSTRSLGVPGALAIASCFPIWTALAGVVFEGQILAPRQWLGLALTVGGVIAVILSDPRREARNSATATAESPRFTEKARREGDVATAREKWRGVALATLTSVLWAVNSYSVARAGRDVSAPVGNSLRMLLAMALSAGLGYFMARGQSIVLPLERFKSSAWIFVLEAYAGSLFFMYGLSHSPLAIGPTLASLAPVLSVPVALAFGLERFSPVRVLGVCVVVAGLAGLVTPP